MSQTENTSIHELRAAGEISYMDGFSGMIEEKDTVGLIDRAVMVTGVSSTATSTAIAASTMDTCNDDTDAPEATPMPFANVTSTSINVTTTSPITTTTVQVFLNTTVAGFFNTTNSTSTVTFITSADALSASITSLAVTSSSTKAAAVSSTSTETCGEWGDGAGPCDRPYGAPNTQPGSTTSTFSAMPMPTTPSVVIVPVTPVVSMMTVSQESMAMSAAGLPAAVSVDAISTSTSSVDSTTTSTTTASSSSISIIDPAVVCAPTATVYVTITASAVEDAPGVTAQSGSGSVTTTTMTTTSLVTTLTETIPGGTDGPEVVTETLPVTANASTATWANTTTTAAFTVTFTPARGGSNNTTTATYAGASSAPTAGVSTIPLMSGGEKALGKPMGASGNASGTGNGLYCVVMLVSLVALLI